MSEASAGISYRVQQLGAEGVRQRLREINQELQAGVPVTKALKTEVKELGVQVNTQNRVVRLNAQAWLESHRTLQSASRVMSAFSSIARSALAITTAWSLATLAFGKTNVNLLEAEQELERINAQLADAISRGADPQTIAELQDRKNVLEATIKELKSEDTQGAITNAINLAASLALIGGGAVTAAAKLGPLVAEGGTLATLATRLGGIATLGPAIGLVAGALAGIYLFEQTKGPDFKPWIMDLSTWDSLNQALRETGFWAGKTFGVDIPLYLSGAIDWFNQLGDKVKFVMNFIKNAVISAVDSIIGAIKKAIDWFGKLIGLGGGKISGSESSKATSSGRVRSRAGGGLITEPVVGMGLNTGDIWTFGEGGKKEIVTPVGSSGGAGTNVFNFYGYDTDQVASKVRMIIKENLRDRGYTGF